MTKSHISVKQYIFAAIPFVLVTWFLLSAIAPDPDEKRLVVYCAHDAIFSEKIIRLFEERTGISVDLKTDTEATKSLGLVNLLIREKDNPRCDLFWNNQLLGTLELQRQGLLQPYQVHQLDRFPSKFKAVDGTWVGFAARLRVFIVNTDKMTTGKMKVTEEAISEMFKNHPENVAVAKPMYGTTLSHYSLLWKEWGSDKLKKWHREIRDKGIKELSGNAMVKNIVAAGTCSVGWTDTDDFFIAQDDGYPVEMLPIRTNDKKTICIPNTVSIIKGTRKPELAARLMDFLLSEEVELLLANSPARQIPLGEIKDSSQLSEDVLKIREWSLDAYPFDGLLESRRECLDWLRSEYLK